MADRVKSSYPSVLNGGTPEAMVLRTSVSALTAFDPLSYAGCNRRWWFTRVGGVKEEETVAQRVGTEGHAQAELYTKTGDDTLGPVMRAGKKFLLTGSDVIVEAQFGDLEGAIARRRAGASLREVQELAGLCANSIPLDGYIDFRHARGEYIDADGVLRKEDQWHGKVVEVGDIKTTSSIESFAKSSVEMASTIQMVGYANYVLNIDPTVDHVRLSHIYFQTRGALLSKKVTALVSAQAAREAWKRVDGIGAQMDEVAKISRVEDVEPNEKSCKAYRGCPHVSRCPIKRVFGGRAMSSLFSKPTTPTNGINGTPPATAATAGSSLFKKTVVSTDAREAAIAAEKARLAQADADFADGAKARQEVQTSYGTCMCGVVLNGLNVSKLPSGEVKHIGCPRAGVVPPDAPKSTLATSAQPMTPEQIAQVEDPEIRQRATDHAAAHAAQMATQPQASSEKKGGRCPQGSQRVLMNDKQKMTRVIACPGCGKDFKAKDDQIDIQDNGVFWIVPKHNLPKVEQQQAPVQQAPAQQAPAQQAPAQQAPVQQAPVQQAPVQQAPVQAGVIPLEDYYLPMVRELEENAGAADIRCASGDSELGYGKWKGALSAYVRMKPPAPGIYVTRSTDEIAMEVINTLRPMCSVGGIMLFIDVAIERDGSVVRGVR